MAYYSTSNSRLKRRDQLVEIITRQVYQEIYSEYDSPEVLEEGMKEAIAAGMIILSSLFPGRSQAKDSPAYATNKADFRDKLEQAVTQVKRQGGSKADIYNLKLAAETQYQQNIKGEQEELPYLDISKELVSVTFGPKTFSRIHTLKQALKELVTFEGEDEAEEENLLDSYLSGYFISIRTKDASGTYTIELDPEAYIEALRDHSISDEVFNLIKDEAKGLPRLDATGTLKNPDVDYRSSGEGFGDLFLQLDGNKGTLQISHHGPWPESLTWRDGSGKVVLQWSKAGTAKM